MAWMDPCGNFLKTLDTESTRKRCCSVTAGIQTQNTNLIL